MEMQVVVLNGSLTDAEQSTYIRQASEKYPIGSIEKLILDMQGDHIEVHYLLHRPRSLRKMGGYFTGNPADWNEAKQAELRDTIPNRIDMEI